MTGSSLIWSLARAAGAAGRSIFLLGGADGVAERAGKVLTTTVPGLRLAGTYCPPFGFERSEQELEAIADAVRKAEPDLVFVGLGFPKQEHLAERLSGVVPGAWFVGCGGAMAMVAGEVARAPGWAQRAGLEWAHRLAQEPRRMAKRYLVHGVPYAAGLLLRAAVGRRRSVSATGSALAESPGVAYLVSQYPALSHAFIEREILALRDLGVRVETYSVRPPQLDAPFSPLTLEEAARTRTLLGRSARDYLGAHLQLLLWRPTALLRGLAAALRSGPPRLRSRVWQVFYLAEAVVLVDDLRRCGVRHIHVHLANNGADIARLAVVVGRAAEGPRAGWRWTLSMHGPTEFDDVVGYDLAAKVRSADAVACISEYSRRRLKEIVEPSHHRKLEIVRMSVSSDAYPAMSAERASREPGRICVLFVGRLVPEKGPELLVEAIRMLVESGLAVEAAIIGQGPLEAALREQIRRLGMTEAVRLVGPLGQDQLPDWYRWADVFCLPSYAEGVPVVLMEAMATELPVVTTHITGIPELVQHGASGYLVEPGDVEAVASAIQTLAGSTQLRREMGSEGRRHVQETFDPHVNAELLIEAIRLRRASDA